MIYNKKNKKRFLSKWTVSGAILLGISTILFFNFSFNKLVEGEAIKWNYESTKDNVFLSCMDNSNHNEKPSLKVIIDSTEILNIATIDQLQKAKSFRLENGKHFLQISTIKNDCIYLDTIEIKNSLFDYRLCVIYSNKSTSDSTQNFIGQFSVIFHDLLKE